MEDIIDDDEMLRHIYYEGEEEENAIEHAWQKYKKDSIEDIDTKRKLKDYLQDMHNMIGDCFDDIDFITFPEIICNAVTRNEDLPVDLVRDFAELLPQDILKHYRDFHHTGASLFDDVNEILADIQHNLKYGHEYKLLWANNKARAERDIHNYLGAILKAYFYKEQIQIDREVDVGIGRIDFRLLNNSLEQVLIEVKLASNANLNTGLVRQLACYMDASRCTQACYLIFCFTDEDYKRGLRFIKELPSVTGKEIAVRLFDARKKLAASKLR